MVRLQWWGLYHDKPKIGTFMLRVKLPSGHLTPAKLRAIAEVSNLYGRGDAELTTRQCIQLHWLELARLPDVFAHLDRAGITTAGGCGDTVRNITGCPLQGLAHDELFDVTPVVEEATRRFFGNPDWANLPRKHKYSISACAERCNAPEINCVALVGVDPRGRARASACSSAAGSRPFRGSRATWASSSRKEEAVEVLARDHRRLVGRPQVPRLAGEGAAEVHDRRHRPRGPARRASRSGSAARSSGCRCRRAEREPSNHLGVREQRRPGLRSVGVPVHLGLVSGDQLLAVADLAERVGGDVRITRQQNFVARERPGGARSAPSPPSSTRDRPARST